MTLRPGPISGDEPTRRRPTPTLLLAIALLALGLIPTAGGGPLRAALRSLHSLDANRVDRATESAGYYVGLIDGDAAGRDELTLRLVGKPAACVNFSDVGVTRFLERDFLQFELLPNLDVRVLGTHFTTNALGQRDRPYALSKPPGVFRVVLLGASIDMGWGVDTEETYENLFEDWLNHHAARLGLTRRFEVLNLAMAAYSPLHRLDTYVRKAAALEPDLVLIALNRLDTRLLQIHLVSLLSERIDLKYPCARDAVARIVPGPSDLADPTRSLTRDSIKTRLEPHLPKLYEDTLAELAERCASAGIPLACLVVPRASDDDGPEPRADHLAWLDALARRLGLPLLDLMSALDDQEPGSIEIAPWDDHPNAQGHKLIFRLLARHVVDDHALYRLFFATDPNNEGRANPRPAGEEGHERPNATPE